MPVSSIAKGKEIKKNLTQMVRYASTKDMVLNGNNTIFDIKNLKLMYFRIRGIQFNRYLAVRIRNNNMVSDLAPDPTYNIKI